MPRLQRPRPLVWATGLALAALLLWVLSLQVDRGRPGTADESAARDLATAPARPLSGAPEEAASAGPARAGIPEGAPEVTLRRLATRHDGPWFRDAEVLERLRARVRSLVEEYQVWGELEEMSQAEFDAYLESLPEELAIGFFPEAYAGLPGEHLRSIAELAETVSDNLLTQDAAPLDESAFQPPYRKGYEETTSSYPLLFLVQEYLGEPVEEIPAVLHPELRRIRSATIIELAALRRMLLLHERAIAEAAAEEGFLSYWLREDDYRWISPEWASLDAQRSALEQNYRDGVRQTLVVHGLLP